MRKFAIVILVTIFVFLVTLASLSAAQRGIKVSAKTPSGKTIPLYSGSYALVIGNGDYTNGWDPLPGAIRDVKDVSRALEENGFMVTLETNLTKQLFNLALETFFHKYGKNKTNRLFFYYAGHGHTQQTFSEEALGYLVMIDSPDPKKDPVGFNLSNVDMPSIVTLAKMTKAKHVLFMFDSCFSGSILNLRDRSVPETISDSISLPVRQFITAGRANEPVPDHSIFKQAFLDLLEGRDKEPIPDGYLTGEELGLYLKNEVPKYNPSQHPLYGKIKDVHLDKGDFVFVLKMPFTVKTPVSDQSNGIRHYFKIMEERKGNRSITEIEEILEEKPEDIDLWLQLGRLAENKNKIKTAINAYKRVIKLSPEHVEASEAYLRLRLRLIPIDKYIADGIDNTGAGLLKFGSVGGVHIDSDKNGRLFAIRGMLTNKNPKSRLIIKIKGSIIDNRGIVVASRTVYAGNTFSENELKTLPLDEIFTSDDNSNFTAKTSLNIASGSTIPFMIVFAGLPNDFRKFSVEMVSCSSEPASSISNEPKYSLFLDHNLLKDRIIGSWKADIDKTKKLPEIKEHIQGFEEKFYPMKWVKVEITDTDLIIEHPDGRRIRETYKVVSQKVKKLDMELQNSIRDIYKFKVLDETHIIMIFPNGLPLVLRSWDKFKETEQEDPEQQAFIVRGHNAAAMSDLKNAFTAQCAYFVDHMTYTNSIKAIKEAGWSPSEGVNLSILDANETNLIMEAFHGKGDSVFIINEAGKFEKRALTPSP